MVSVPNGARLPAPSDGAMARSGGAGRNGGGHRAQPARVRLGVLDQSPICEGGTAGEAIRQTVSLAVAAERLGYSRYWVAEHHASEAFAGTAPEILVAHLGACTSTIRVGSGGVMLGHYAPFKVAEIFRVLEALYPQRVDLGIGRGAGGGPSAVRALRSAGGSFSDLFAELLGLVRGAPPGDQTERQMLAQPCGTTAPQPWLLGASAESAAHAARVGCAFSFAHFINGGCGPGAMAEYRAQFRPSPWLASPQASVAVFVLCADTDAQARRLASSRDVWGLWLDQGVEAPIPPPERAMAYRCTDAERHRLAAGRRARIVGTPEQVRERLSRLAELYGVEELLILSICHDFAARLRSYQLLAQVFELSDCAGAATRERASSDLR
jgi:luciferase family oxidoreductase group 1